MSLVTGPIFQICWVVEDLDAAERHFTDQFGVARWLRLPNVHFGPGVHHVAWVPDDFEATLAEAASRGLPIVQQGRFEGVGMEFAYLDGGPLGSYVELMKLSEEMRAMFDSLSSPSDRTEVILATHYTLSLANSTELGHWRP